ncbi:MAG TPA: hypothetical protein VJZ26_08145 [Blastocatellia bacterium]|nr:hypothetical protein [Blastocatellia bacterium]
MNKNLRLLVVLALLAAAVVAGILLFRHRGKLRGPETPPPVSGPPSLLPEMKDKPKPRNVIFKGCPPEGDGGDPALNRLKNRVDEAGEYIAVPFDSLAGLGWPQPVERRDRDRWSASDAEAVARYEGMPVSVEGYLVATKKEGPESCNCHGAGDEFRDYHVWITKGANEDKSGSIVVEVTPPIRFKHPVWTSQALGRVARADQKTRISGWLLLDPEHPDQVGKTRATIWEIHPVMKIEVEQQGRWVTLDSITNQ